MNDAVGSVFRADDKTKTGGAEALTVGHDVGISSTTGRWWIATTVLGPGNQALNILAPRRVDHELSQSIFSQSYACPHWSSQKK